MNCHGSERFNKGYIQFLPSGWEKGVVAMRVPQPLVMATGSGITTLIGVFWQRSVEMMMPWLFVILSAVVADLASGHYKAGRLGIHFAWSTAIRESAGKIVVYISFVMTAAMFDVAAEGSATIAKWLCLFVSAIEIGSALSNILIVHGVKLNLKAILKLILKKTPFGIDDEAADEIIKTARREDKKWNKSKFRKFKEDEEPINAFERATFRREIDEETGKTTYNWNE